MGGRPERAGSGSSGYLWEKGRKSNKGHRPHLLGPRLLGGRVGGTSQSPAGPRPGRRPPPASGSYVSRRYPAQPREAKSAGQRAHCPSPCPTPPREDPVRCGALTWDPSRAASAVCTQPAALKCAPPPPGAGPYPSPADLSLSSPSSLPHLPARPRRRPGNPSSRERALPSVPALP